VKFAGMRAPLPNSSPGSGSKENAINQSLWPQPTRKKDERYTVDLFRTEFIGCRDDVLTQNRPVRESLPLNMETVQPSYPTPAQKSPTSSPNESDSARAASHPKFSPAVVCSGNCPRTRGSLI
jgi:hypothetical protein